MRLSVPDHPLLLHQEIPLDTLSITQPALPTTQILQAYMVQVLQMLNDASNSQSVSKNLKYCEAKAFEIGLS